MNTDDDSTTTVQWQAEPSLVGRIVFWFGVLLSLTHLYFNTFATLPELWTSSIHFAGFGFLCVLLFPLRKTTQGRRAPGTLAIDLTIGCLAMICAAYLILAEDAFYQRGSSFIFSDWLFSLLCIAIAIEFTRRTTGWLIPVLIVLSLTYVIGWGRWVGGVFNFPGLTAETVLFREYFGTDGMFGPIARISSTYVFMFILFGAFLVRSGAGEFIIQLALCAAGRWVGGPGLVAVFGSALMGSISGSAVANTVSTGIITIPLMKRAGFPARFAAGVEAAASTGGQLMPPVMGAGAFIMSTYTQIPYVDIIGVATLPALLYFISVAIWVRIEAMKLGIRGDTENAPRFLDVIKSGGHHLIPIIVLVTLLIVGFTPTYAAGFSILSVVVASWLSPQRMGPRAIVEALALGARNMASVAVLLVAVGIIVNVISTTGIGNTFSLMITQWASGNLLIMLILIALASLVLGMGLPVTAAYIVLATLSAPALYDLISQAQLVDAIAAGAVPEQAKAIFMLVAPDQLSQLGSPMPLDQAAALVGQVPADFMNTLSEQVLSPAVLSAALLSAHMIIFWLSQDSNVTPPVCLCAFAAAALAGTPPMSTGLMAWKIAKGLYIVPLLIAFTPFLSGDVGEDLVIFGFGVAGIYALNGAIDGHMEAPLAWLGRSVSLGAATALLWPHSTALHLVGLGLLAGVFALNWRTRPAVSLA
ncbi:MAG: TRAP transporter fused permease subunit [Gammaproteobacteria bacterium]|nr:TRAP transporter fused permease subunit [Gammaproteobacteria bacterium]MCP5426275.1 TRAP transporter fused permease subunit [Gammaproteobacteria bacterium]